MNENINKIRDFINNLFVEKDNRIRRFAPMTGYPVIQSSSYLDFSNVSAIMHADLPVPKSCLRGAVGRADLTA